MTHVERTRLAVRDTSSGAGAGGGALVELEARWDLPAEPQQVVVLCHPHPKQRGTMNAPLMEALTTSLVPHGFAVLRFNFRGVGESTGTHDSGIGELDDVAAAVDAAAAAYPQLQVGVAGWSFGAATSLRWQARDDSHHAWVGVAPPVDSSRSMPLPTKAELTAASRTLILGDRDQFATVETTQGYADSIGAELRVLKGSDHFFYFREDKVAGLIAEGLGERA